MLINNYASISKLEKALFNALYITSTSTDFCEQNQATNPYI